MLMLLKELYAYTEKDEFLVVVVYSNARNILNNVHITTISVR